VSPQAWVLISPTDSSASQIAGTSSIRIQWYWMFCRSVTSAVAARVPGADVGEHPQLGEVDGAAVDAHPEHEVLVVQLVRLQGRRPAAVDAGAALGVEAPTSAAGRAGPRAECWRIRRGRRW
jgi:hypothetical protein